MGSVKMGASCSLMMGTTFQNVGGQVGEGHTHEGMMTKGLNCLSRTYLEGRILVGLGVG